MRRLVLLKPSHLKLMQKRNLFNFHLPGSAVPKDQIYSEKRLLGYSPKQMYQVVAGVEDYHKFVPWCKKSKVITRTPNALKAELVIGFPPLGENYTSHVKLFEPHLVTAVCVDMNLFHHLKTVWKIDESGLEDNPLSCRIDFAVSFRFRHTLHSNVSSLFFDEVIRQNVNAFLKEARKRYGPESMPKQSPEVYMKNAR